ncbi:MAG: LLM class flavin-dependent oxidoreductase [Acidimicrobiia bacterium]|nr:LLM class flavin-dependent oxidoreductase [Acidimicrobiia bacterium]
MESVEFGLDTFGDVTQDLDGRAVPAHQVIRDVVAQGVLADQVGVDAFGIGEHHRDDYAVSAPEVVLAAIAGQTERIRLGSAVTVLSSDDPVRVFERFATLDAVSKGRAEVQLGRGSFTESFPLFGFDLEQYGVLFEEKLDLFVQLLDERPVTWSGLTRASLTDQSVFPTTESGRLDAWVGVGGSPESVVRAAKHGLGLMLAIIGGDPTRFRPLVDLYHRALDTRGLPSLPIAVHSPGYIAATDEQARDELFGPFKVNRDRIGAERGWPPVGRAEFDREAGPSGSLYVGSPDTVARKIARTVSTLGIQRFDLKYSNGPLPHGLSMKAIELYGTKVIPQVRDLLAEARVPAAV